MLALARLTLTTTTAAALALTPAGTGPVADERNPCAATAFVLQDLEKEPAVVAPDGRHRILLRVRTEDDDYGWVRIYTGDRLIGSFDLRDLSAGVYVNWSPDSGAVYVMWSNGGAIGGYDVRVFRVTDQKATEVPTTRIVDREFQRAHPCPTRGANDFAITFLRGSQEFLLALQVYPTSDCGNEAGFTRGYRVRVMDGHIVQRYSEGQLKARWPAGCPTDVFATAFMTSDDLRKAQGASRRKRK